jgi:exoribonuclease R
MSDPEIAREYVDWRDKRVFTIDPTSSRDLDDAMSIERLPNGQFHIYVYVADVCRFVKEGDEIDLDAR